jgi:hypothetical protein
MCIAALFTTAKKWNHPKCPSTDNWIKKMWYIYTIVCIQTQKEEISVVCDNTKEPGGLE